MDKKLVNNNNNKTLKYFSNLTQQLRVHIRFEMLILWPWWFPRKMGKQRRILMCIDMWSDNHFAYWAMTTFAANKKRLTSTILRC